MTPFNVNLSRNKAKHTDNILIAPNHHYLLLLPKLPTFSTIQTIYNQLRIIIVISEVCLVIISHHWRIQSFRQSEARNIFKKGTNLCAADGEQDLLQTTLCQRHNSFLLTSNIYLMSCVFLAESKHFLKKNITSIEMTRKSNPCQKNENSYLQQMAALISFRIF